MPASQTLVVTPDFLKQLQAAFMLLQALVEENLNGTGQTIYGQEVPVVDSTLSVYAGGPAGQGAASSSSNGGGFKPAFELNAKLGTAGGSIHDQLVRWQKWCSDIISDIGTTLTNFANTNDFNTQTVQQLLDEFPLTISDMSGTGTSGSTG